MRITTIYRKPMNGNLFEEEYTIEALSRMGNPLEQLASLVDVEMSRPTTSSDMCKSTYTNRNLSPVKDNCVHMRQIIKINTTMTG